MFKKASKNAAYWQSSQIRQGIANNTKGTAFVVYEDVMDAKQACDKLNGFNFQNRYLVGTSISPSSWGFPNLSSAISSTRQDGQVETGPRRAQGEFRAAQEAARYRITTRRAYRTSTSTCAYISQGVGEHNYQQQQAPKG
jgi:RNA recognition motif-containing protein